MRGGHSDGRRRGMEALLIEDPAALERVRAGWDELAAACARPFCAPAWQIAWWRHVGAARGGSLRVAAVLDGGRVVAIAPCFTERERGLAVYRLLGAGTSSPVEPL